MAVTNKKLLIFLVKQKFNKQPRIPLLTTVASSALQGFSRSCSLVTMAVNSNLTDPPTTSQVETNDTFRVGTVYATFKDMYQCGMHKTAMAGIYPWSGNRPAESVVMCSPSLYQNQDMGDRVWYTGQGLSGDQAMAKGNMALKIALEQHAPVRLIRGYKLNSPYAPGYGYRYDGLYFVVDYREVTQNLRKIFQFRMVRMEGQPELPSAQVPVVSEKSSIEKEQADWKAGIVPVIQPTPLVSRVGHRERQAQGSHTPSKGKQTKSFGKAFLRNRIPDENACIPPFSELKTFGDDTMQTICQDKCTVFAGGAELMPASQFLETLNQKTCPICAGYLSIEGLRDSKDVIEVLKHLRSHLKDFLCCLTDAEVSELESQRQTEQFYYAQTMFCCTQVQPKFHPPPQLPPKTNAAPVVSLIGANSLSDLPSHTNVQWDKYKKVPEGYDSLCTQKLTLFLQPPRKVRRINRNLGNK